MWQDILEMIVADEPEDDVVAIDATDIKAHQDTCRHGSEPVEQGFGKTKGGRTSKIARSTRWSTAMENSSPCSSCRATGTR